MGSTGRNSGLRQSPKSHKISDYIQMLEDASIYLAGPETYAVTGYDVVVILDRKDHLTTGIEEVADSVTEEIVHGVRPDLEHPAVYATIRWLMRQQAWREAVYKRLADELLKWRNSMAEKQSWLVISPARKEG